MVEGSIIPGINQHGLVDFFYQNKYDAVHDPFLSKNYFFRWGVYIWSFENVDIIYSQFVKHGSQNFMLINGTELYR